MNLYNYTFILNICCAEIQTRDISEKVPNALKNKILIGVKKFIVVIRHRSQRSNRMFGH